MPLLTNKGPSLFLSLQFYSVFSLYFSLGIFSGLPVVTDTIIVIVKILVQLPPLNFFWFTFCAFLSKIYFLTLLTVETTVKNRN